MGSSVETLRLEAIQRRVTKIIKRVKDYSYRERLEKLEFTTLLERRMRGDLAENYKIMNEFQIMADIFSIYFLKLEIYCREISKTKSTNQLYFFLPIEWYIFGTSCLIRSKTAIG